MVHESDVGVDDRLALDHLCAGILRPILRHEGPHDHKPAASLSVRGRRGCECVSVVFVGVAYSHVGRETPNG